METDGLPDPGAWRAVLLAQSAAQHAIEAELSAAGVVSLPWYDVLLELRAAPELRLRMHDLAERVVLSRTRVSRLVGELEAAGLVRRERDPDDGRAWFAVITEEGRRARRAAAPVYLAAIDRHFTSHLTSQQARVIELGLTAVAQAHVRERRRSG